MDVSGALRQLLREELSLALDERDARLRELLGAHYRTEGAAKRAFEAALARAVLG